MKENTTFIQAVYPSHFGGATLFLAYRQSDLLGSDREQKATSEVKQPENTLTTRVRNLISGLTARAFRTPRIRARAPQVG